MPSDRQYYDRDDRNTSSDRAEYGAFVRKLRDRGDLSPSEREQFRDVAERLGIEADQVRDEIQ